MLDRFLARVKMTGMVLLFLAPVAAAAWNNSLDEFFAHNQRYEAPDNHLAAELATEIAVAEVDTDIQP